MVLIGHFVKTEQSWPIKSSVINQLVFILFEEHGF